MANTLKKVTPTLRIVNNSILTFECAVRVSSIITNSLIFELEDSLPKGLSYIEKSEAISYSTDCGSTYTPCDDLICCCCFDDTDNKLQVILAPPKPLVNPIPQSEDYKYIFMKISFKVIVTDVSALSTPLVNKGEVYGDFWYKDSQGVYDIPPQSIILCDYLIEKYSFMVAGYSINVCNNFCSLPLKAFNNCPSSNNHQKFKEDFTAKFLFNALSGDYGIFDTNNNFTSTCEYTLTIKPTKGIHFPTEPTEFEKIKVSIDNQDIAFNPDIEDNNLLITFLHIGTTNTNPNDNTAITCNMVSKPVLVSIPYSIDCCSCITSPYIIEGSIDLIDTVSGKILVSLDNFCLCVNTQCSDLIGIGKNVLC